MLSLKRHPVLIGAIAVLVVIVAGGGIAFYSFIQRNVPQTYADAQEHFKYGSIGSDGQDGGVPYAIWRVLPTVFADKLPDRPGNGYARFGFVYETPQSPRPKQP